MEIVIAIAVTSFCLVGIISLLPVGLNTARESRNETRAAYLANQIVNDLRTSPYAAATILAQTAGSSTLSTLTTVNLATTTPLTNFLECDGENNIVAVASPGQYNGGSHDANVISLVQVVVKPTAIANLAQVSVEVSAPAQAVLGARERYGFQTMIGNRQ